VRLEPDPFTGTPVVALAPLRPDVAILHADCADEAGNAVVSGPTWGLREAACAARNTVVLAEQVVPTGSLSPDAITIPGPFVSAVVHVERAAYPTAAAGLYDYDSAHLERYMAAAAEGGDAYARYLDEFVYGVDSHEQFLERGGRVTLDSRQLMAVAASHETPTKRRRRRLSLPQIASLCSQADARPGVTLVLESACWRPHRPDGIADRYGRAAGVRRHDRVLGYLLHAAVSLSAFFGAQVDVRLINCRRSSWRTDRSAASGAREAPTTSPRSPGG
jgi:hypothetical protein